MAKAGPLSGGVIKSASMPIALTFILAILMLPMPTAVLDICIAVNITISLVILFGSLFMKRILDFTAFPAMLLVTTLFRLSMNVASTRLILLNGEYGLSAAGTVIQAFGEFVVGGSFVVGVVIFIAISIVNLKVITKGSSRIAEVAARFTLDAMPGKQMAIDSDLNTGLIGEEEAKAKRKELSQESEFYGAMDGAAKFVSGDASAGLFITGINIIGGLFVGILFKEMDWREAAETYTLLTIGDGLVSQIPSIIISTASGLIVARAASAGDDLGSEVVSQLTASSRPLWISSGVCGLLAIVPGLPFLPFMFLCGLTGGVAFVSGKGDEESSSAGKSPSGRSGKAQLEGGGGDTPELEGPKPGSTEEVTGLLGVDTLELEVGYELVSLVEQGDLLERIRSLRRQFALDYGFIVPAIHIRDNVRLQPGAYRFLLRGCAIGEGELKSRHLLAMDPGSVSAQMEGIPTKEPAFGLDAIWIPDSEKERAQFAGYTVVDLSTVVTTHITELVRSHMHELLGRQEVQHLLDNIASESPKIVEELVPAIMPLGQVQQVLSLLLREQISIRDLKTILETLADWGPTVKSPERLAEFVRRRVSRALTNNFLTEEGLLPVVSLAGPLERDFMESLQQSDEGTFLALDPGQAQAFVNKLHKAAERFAPHGYSPLLITNTHLRPALYNFIEKFVPGFAVISHQEVAAQTKVHSLGVIQLEAA